MTSLIKSDIFFFVTTIAVVVLSVAGLLVTLMIFRILRHIEYVSKKIRQESDNLTDDIAEMRSKIKDQLIYTRFGIGSFLRLFFGGNRADGSGVKSTQNSKSKSKTGRKAKVTESDIL